MAGLSVPCPAPVEAPSRHLDGRTTLRCTSGLFLINIDVCATDPAAAVRIAVAAEAAGWESVWTGEHYVLPDPPSRPRPRRATLPMLDPFVALAHLAAHTDTLRLAPVSPSCPSTTRSCWPSRWRRSTG